MFQREQYPDIQSIQTNHCADDWVLDHFPVGIADSEKEVDNQEEVDTQEVADMVEEYKDLALFGYCNCSFKVDLVTLLIGWSKNVLD